MSSNQSLSSMVIKLVLIVLYASVSLGLYSQRPTLELTFTAIENIAHIKLDSIKVMNRTQGGDTVLHWPDTVLSIYYVGIPENSALTSRFQVFQNYPNPVIDRTTISLYVPDKDRVSLAVTDILGRAILKSDRILEKGTHAFRFTPGDGILYFFTALWRGNSSSIKILQVGFHKEGQSTLEYTGSKDSSRKLKAIKEAQRFSFTTGDELLYIGYIDTLQSGILDAPEESQTYTFQYATNIPCPGTPTVVYGGQVYNTIQIFSQCWLKENLNIGTMISGNQFQTNNGTTEKYCYNNEPDSCTKYGGLYQWWEMMQYTTQQDAQGICPPGWHLPTDEEWKVLEGAVDSQYGIGDPEWDYEMDLRGLDAGRNLKTTTGWKYGGNGTNLFSFSGLPGGFRSNNGVFLNACQFGYWSTSREHEDHLCAYYRTFNYYSTMVWQDYYRKEFGNSVRCIRDY